jgi:DNA-binding CsgD family transcriptional regulator
MRPATNAVKWQRAEELADVATRIGRWTYLGPSAYHRSILAYQHGDAAALAAAHADLERTAVAAGQRYWNYLAGCATYATMFIQARFDEARRCSEDLLAMSDVFTGGDAEGPYGIQSFMVRRETLGVQRVRALVSGEEAYEGRWLPALLALYVELGLTEAARRTLGHLLQHRLPQEEESGRWPATLAFAAEAAIGLHDRQAGAEVRDLLLEYSGLNLVMAPFSGVFGAADRYLGELESLLGERTAGPRFEAALTLDTKTGSVLHRAYTLAGWAMHARATGDGPLATRLHEEAATLAARPRMPRVLACLKAATASGRRSTPAVAGLSEREQEVLRHLGSGLSNRQIAKALTISEHTAANHVRNIMTKIGCTNRTQAAMFAAEHGLLD